MSDYKRLYRKHGTYFFTVVTYKRKKIFSNEQARKLLRESIQWVNSRHPFETIGMVLLPDHLHCIWQMPENDDNFSLRWNMIKRRFTIHWNQYKNCRAEAARPTKKNEPVWQPRFWEHLIRDREDFENHMKYIHYNPAKHGLVTCPHLWSHSTFHKWAKQGVYKNDWYCKCNNKDSGAVPDFIEKISQAGE